MKYGKLHFFKPATRLIFISSWLVIATTAWVITASLVGVIATTWVVASVVITLAVGIWLLAWVISPLALGRGVGGEAVVPVFRVLNDTLVCTGYALHFLTCTVVAGDLDGGVCQLVLQVGRGSEDDAATADKARLYLVHVGYTLGAEAESHATQSGDCYAVTLSGPCLDYLACCIPSGLHYTLADSAAQGSFLNHFLLIQSGVQLWRHDVAVGVGVLANLLEFLICFYFQHSLMCVSWPPPCFALLRVWGFAHLCGAVATFSGYSKDPSRPFGGVLSLGTVVHN